MENKTFFKKKFFTQGPVATSRYLSELSFTSFGLHHWMDFKATRCDFSSVRSFMNRQSAFNSTIKNINHVLKVPCGLLL